MIRRMFEATWPIPILLAVTSVLGLVAALPILAIILTITRATLARRT